MPALAGAMKAVLLGSSSLVAAFSFNFAEMEALPAGTNYSRSTGAMQFRNDGLLAWAPENLLTQSNNFAAADWQKKSQDSGTVPVVTAGFAAGPDGTPGAASRLQCSMGTPVTDGQSFITQDATFVGQREVKVWLKLNTGTSQTVYLRIASGTGPNTVTVTNQWQQFTQTDVGFNSNSNGVNIGLRSGATGINNTLDVLVAYAHQYRVPTVSTAYIDTTASVYFGPRFDYDPVTLQPLGYLSEVQSTNTVLHSQDTAGWAAANVVLTGNAVAAPDGTTTAMTMLLSAGSALHQITSATTFSYTSGSIYGMSMFVKNIVGSSWMQFTFGGNSGFNFQPSTGTVGTSLSGTQSNVVVRQCAGGWWRISFYFTAAATTSSNMAVNFASASNSAPAPTITGDGTSTIAVWGFQMDAAGVGVLSYIPTITSTVTRAADLAPMPLSALPGWQPNEGGVLVATFQMQSLTPVTQQNPVYISDLGSNNVDCRANSGTQGGQIFGLLTRATVIQINSVGPFLFSAPIFARRRGAWGWGTTRGQIAVDGSAVTVLAGAFALPVGMTTFSIGGAGTNNLNGTVESLDYYPGARPDEFVRQVSQQ